MLSREMIKSGFVVPDMKAPKRMLVASDGLERTGKTEFMLSAPGPLDIIDIDNGLEGVAEKWVKSGKEVRVYRVKMPAFGLDKTYLNEWKGLQYAYRTALQSNSRTIGIDTGSDMWELMRLAEFGQLAPSADIKRAYNQLNQLYRSLIREAYSTNKNLIITHKLKENWTVKKTAGGKDQDVWDGTYKRSGFREASFLIQVNVRHTHDKETGTFSMLIENSRQNMSASGFELFNEDISFANLGKIIFPGTDDDDWS